jgi:hypothetical protein
VGTRLRRHGRVVSPSVPPPLRTAHRCGRTHRARCTRSAPPVRSPRGTTLWLSNHLPPFEGGSTALSTALALLGALATSAGLLLLAVRTARRRKPESAS